MKKYRILIVVPFLIIIIITNSCESWRNCYEGNGVITTEQRLLSGFYGVVSSADLDVHIVQDTVFSVHVIIDENLQSVIRTNVKGDMLYVEVSRDRCIRTSSVPQVYVHMPEVYEVENEGPGKIYSDGIIYSSDIDIIISGSGDIEMDLDISSDVRIFVNGSGDVELYGYSEDGDIRIDGSGDVYACGMEIDDCYVTIDGSGDVYVFVDSRIDIEINGSGDVHYDYSGIPPIERIDGFGSGDVYVGRCY